MVIKLIIKSLKVKHICYEFSLLVINILKKKKCESCKTEFILVFTGFAKTCCLFFLIKKLFVEKSVYFWKTDGSIL